MPQKNWVHYSLFKRSKTKESEKIKGYTQGAKDQQGGYFNPQLEGESVIPFF